MPYAMRVFGSPVFYNAGIVAPTPTKRELPNRIYIANNSKYYIVPNSLSYYAMNNIVLENPCIASAPPIINGKFMHGQAFVLMWDSPLSPTQNAMQGGKIGSMQVIVAGESIFGINAVATVFVESTVMYGNLMLSSMRVV